MQNTNRTFKQQAHALVDELPDNATWYDLMFSAGERYDRESGYAELETADEAATGSPRRRWRPRPAGY